MTSKGQSSAGMVAKWCPAVIGGQLFGLPISRVQDVFMPERLTRVPLSSREIAGVLNLRGRIVTVVDMRARLGLPKVEDGRPPMGVGFNLQGPTAPVVEMPGRLAPTKVEAGGPRRVVCADLGGVAFGPVTAPIGE